MSRGGVVAASVVLAVTLASCASVVKSIADPGQVRAAARFARANETGWKDPLSGPQIPQYLLRFFTGSRFLGGYGIGSGYLVSDPTVNGFWSHPVPPDEIRALAAILGLALEER